eukprot:2325027-Ditylum_brightwellii.AAC.1
MGEELPPLPAKKGSEEETMKPNIPQGKENNSNTQETQQQQMTTTKRQQNTTRENSNTQEQINKLTKKYQEDIGQLQTEFKSAMETMKK